MFLEQNCVNQSSPEKQNQQDMRMYIGREIYFKEFVIVEAWLDKNPQDRRVCFRMREELQFESKVGLLTKFPLLPGRSVFSIKAFN